MKPVRLRASGGLIADSGNYHRYAAIPEVQRLCAALIAIADHGDSLPVEEPEVRIRVVKHGRAGPCGTLSIGASFDSDR